METLIERGCGLDVHKKSVAACVMRFPEPKGTRQSHVRTFGTMAAELAALREWLESQEVTPVAMEHRGCNGSPCGPCSRRPSPACWSTRPPSSRSRGARATCWIVPGSPSCWSTGSCGGASCRQPRSGNSGISPATASASSKSARARPTGGLSGWRTPGSSSPRSPPTCSGSRAGPCSRRWGRARPIQHGWPTGRAASCGRSARRCVRPWRGGFGPITRSWSVSSWLTWTIWTRRSTRSGRASLG